MSRTLPLGPQNTAAEGAGESAASALSGTILVFDPPMCCPTGLCGPGVDPALLTLARDLRWLEKHGVVVRRYGLAQEPEAFAANARVAGLMQAFGDGALPATLVNDAVLCHGRYPTRAELEAALGGAGTAAAPAVRGGCAPGSGCC